MTTTHRLLMAARARHWVLTTAELQELGLSREAIRHRVRTGTLHRLFPGVYAVGRPELAPHGRWRAATLTAPDTVLSDYSGAALWAVVAARPGPIHVTVPTQAGRGKRSGLVVHRCDRLVPADVTARDGIPVTTLTRTLRDLAGPLDAKHLTRAVRQAERLHGFDLHRAHAAMGPPRPGANRENRLRKVLEAYVPGLINDGLEEAFLELCVRFGLPLPVTQLAIGRRFADFAWPDVRLVVETDDRGSHDTWSARQEDVARDRELAAMGWEVMRFTWAEITRKPDMVAREIDAALIRRRQMVA